MMRRTQGRRVGMQTLVTTTLVQASMIIVMFIYVIRMVRVILMMKTLIGTTSRLVSLILKMMTAT